jgi:hypothetical protein
MRIHRENLHTRKLFPDHGAEFAGLKVREQGIEQKDLAEKFVQALKRFGAAGSFRQIPSGLTKLLPQLEAKPAVGTDEQHADGIAFIHTKPRQGRRAHTLLSTFLGSHSDAT